MILQRALLWLYSVGIAAVVLGLLASLFVL
jgi:hypothetical protein